jgi:hypothetical protein
MTPNSPSLPITFSGSVSREEFSRVNSLLLPRWMRWYFFVPCVVYLFVSIGVGWTAALHHPLAAAPDLAVAALVLAAAAAITIYLRSKNWRSVTSLTGKVHGAATVSGIEWNTDNTSARFAWEKLVKVRRARDLTLVFFAPRCAFYFPRSFFESDDSWKQFNDVLDANVVSRFR